MIKCPQCNGELFMVIPIMTLKLNGNEIVIDEPQKNMFSCIKCGHRVETKDDIEPTTVIIYIIGDSHSGRRQGLNRIYKEHKFSFPLANESLDLSGYVNIEKAWIFTKSAWKKFKGGETFPLADNAHKIEEINLIEG